MLRAPHRRTERSVFPVSREVQMAQTGDIGASWGVKRASLLREIELVRGAIERCGRNGEISEIRRQWLEKLEKWRDDLEELLLKLPDQPG
jgi:hypothetical protein